MVLFVLPNLVLLVNKLKEKDCEIFSDVPNKLGVNFACVEFVGGQLGNCKFFAMASGFSIHMLINHVC